MEAKFCKESRVIRTGRIFPNHVNNHHTLFGGQLMNQLDEVASTSAARHSRKECMTVSSDSIDFFCPVRTTDSVNFESYVTWTGHSSMEVFVKVIAEDLKSGHRKIAATAFLKFVALDENKKPTFVPRVIPESEEEKKLYKTAIEREALRKERKQKNKELSAFLTTNDPWETSDYKISV